MAPRAAPPQAAGCQKLVKFWFQYATLATKIRGGSWGKETSHMFCMWQNFWTVKKMVLSTSACEKEFAMLSRLR